MNDKDARYKELKSLEMAIFFLFQKMKIDALQGATALVICLYRMSIMFDFDLIEFVKSSTNSLKNSEVEKVLKTFFKEKGYHND